MGCVNIIEMALHDTCNLVTSKQFIEVIDLIILLDVPQISRLDQYEEILIYVGDFLLLVALIRVVVMQPKGHPPDRCVVHGRFSQSSL